MSSEALRRLAHVYGIEAEYLDCAGERHATSDDTRARLLAAMGVTLDGDLDSLAEAAEAHPWRGLLPPVAVVRDDAAAAVTLTLPARRLREPWHWRLVREDGGEEGGPLDPAALEPVARRQFVGAELVRLRLPLPGGLPLGYHRLEVGPGSAPGAGGDERGAAAMPLVVAPATCHLPEALAAGARLWGPVVQLYGLRSRRNWGIGDFGDLRGLVELGAGLGAGFVGLNPLHAGFLADPARASPYRPASRLFLNVLHLDLEAVAEVADSPEARALLDEPGFQARLRRVRAAELVDYEEVAALKLPVLRLGHAQFRRQHLAHDTPRARAFQRFRDEGGEALRRYALFDALDAHCRAADAAAWGWPAWPDAYRSPEAAGVRDFAAGHAEEVEFAVWLQWLADQQLGTAARQAKLQGMALGLYRDLAVGTDPGGAETWADPGLYARGAHIGAPPDDFSPHGQDWGLPPPVPRRLREAAYGPFIAILGANMRHAGALRIDHVMGLARLFWVPAGEPAAAGAYVRYPLDDLLGILALESRRHQCLVVGEDLGTVPPDLRQRLAAAGVLSCRLLYFERDAEGGFRPPADYPRQALAAVGTHDLPTLAGFWQGRDIDERARLGMFASPGRQDAAVVARAQDRARLLLALQHEALLPEGLAVHPVAVPAVTPPLATAVHAWLARTPAWLLAVQAEDIFGAADQANLPGTTEGHPNWRRRLPPDLEDWPADGRLRLLAEALRRERGAAPAAGREGTGRPDRPTAVIPRATYRLQFNRDFTLAQATELVPYLAELGISHVYASPLLKARPGSRHGYDIVDHNALNPEIGGEEVLAAFARALGERGMGLILDMVPNHMGVMGADNAWWLDVLENGEASAFAEYFDIDWQPLNPELAGKVLLPLLGDHYGTVLGRGQLQLGFDAAAGEFSLHYYGHRLPIDPATYPAIVGRGLEPPAAGLAGEPRLATLQGLLTAFGHLPARGETAPEKIAERARDKELHKRRLAALCAASPAIAAHVATNLAELNGRAGDAASFDALHQLIKAQAWRLAHWRVAADDINYRRFFDINDLAALRMESRTVFDATHRLVLSLIRRGLVQGLRIDHADGLYDPARYFRRLQAAVAGIGEDDVDPGALPLYLVIEKILAEHERLPEEWAIHGATGYRFAQLVNGLFVDGAAEARLSRIYAGFVGTSMEFDELAYQARKLIIRWSLQGELNVLANRLARIAAASRHTCDFTLNSLRGALADVVACFPVYRSYLADGRLSADDRRHIEWAVALARRRSPAADTSVFDFVGQVLTGDIAEGKELGYRDQVLYFAMKFQQYTAPVMAKGIEDTACYRYLRLVSLNDVGGDPRRFGVGVAAFHAANRARAGRWPHTLLAGSTHDSKRSEDVRARIDVLSEVPAAWRLSLRRWARLNRSRKRLADGEPAPSRNDEYLLYQTLFGTWPLAGDGDPATYGQRITEYLCKAAREAKEHTSWINVNVEYEAALAAFVQALLAGGEDDNLFLADFLPAMRRLARFGLINGLAQTLLRLTAPGVPDIYQGCELWQFHLVDPDNRRPVDYELRRRLLLEVVGLQWGDPAGWRERLRPLAAAPEDGRLKLYLIWCALHWRRRWHEVFRDGEYLPLAVAGPAAEHVCAYARRHGPRIAVTAVPRLLAKLAGASAAGEVCWQDTRIELPAAWAGHGWFNALTGETVAGTPAPAVAALFALLPVALLVSDGGAAPDPHPAGAG